MTGEEILGVIIMTGCALGCGAMCHGIGVWASRMKTPMGFWTGVAVDPKTVTDIPAYNRANARMWKRFAIPFWLTGLASLGSIFFPWAFKLAVALLILECTVGIVLLIAKYKKIRAMYMVSG